MSSDGAFDNVLLRFAQSHDNVEQMIFSMLSFFERRTDLFHVMETPQDKMGFMPGVAEQMLLNLFRHFQKDHQDKLEAAVKAAASIADPVTSVSSSAPAAPVESTSMPKKMSRISTWNGAATDKYCWSQSIYELTLEVEVEATSAREIEVDLSATRLSIMCRDVLVLSGKLHEKINTEESVWHLDGKNLIISMQKVRQTWWKCVLEGDEEIDTTKVESTRSMEEYDGETQGAIRKIMFDQCQKAKGQATSDQIRTADVMKDAWNAPGSPFFRYRV